MELPAHIDESARIEGFSTLKRSCTVDLGGIRRINSIGVRTWLNAMQSIPSGITVTFIRCSPAMVDQANMINGFFGTAVIDSILAPMSCTMCATEAEIEVAIADCEEGIPLIDCAHCGQAMALDALQDRYLYFLRTAPQAA